MCRSSVGMSVSRRREIQRGRNEELPVEAQVHVQIYARVPRTRASTSIITSASTEQLCVALRVQRGPSIQAAEASEQWQYTLWYEYSYKI